MRGRREGRERGRDIVAPSSDPALPGHLLTRGEKGNPANVSALEPPSALVGEGPGVKGRDASTVTQAQYSHEPHRQKERRNRGFAKAMRRNPTEAERKLWLLLKDRRFADHKFRRQVPIGPFIADFVCYSTRLIIELDGSQHADDARDIAREDWFAAKGFGILRFWNNDLTTDAQAVSDAIWHKLTGTDHGAK